jgi:hypothetical protein
MTALNIVVSLLHDLHDAEERDKLKGKRVHYRTRWQPDEPKAGTVRKVAGAFIWIDSACLAHRDIIIMTEVPE